jgi:hypothetical protein
MTAGSTDFAVTSSNNATITTGKMTWNFAMITAPLLGSFSPQREARNEQPDFGCAPMEQQQHAPCLCISREQQH